MLTHILMVLVDEYFSFIICSMKSKNCHVFLLPGSKTWHLLMLLLALVSLSSPLRFLGWCVICLPFLSLLTKEGYEK